MHRAQSDVIQPNDTTWDSRVACSPQRLRRTPFTSLSSSPSQSIPHQIPAKISPQKKEEDKNRFAAVLHVDLCHEFGVMRVVHISITTLVCDCVCPVRSDQRPAITQLIMRVMLTRLLFVLCFVIICHYGLHSCRFDATAARSH